MRHLNATFKLGRDGDHRRCLLANMVKSLVTHGSITTTLPKAKIVRREADKMITLAKKNTLAASRRAIGRLMISFNSLSSKESREAKKETTEGKISKHYNDDRFVMKKLAELAQRYSSRQGGYTRIKKIGYRVGDNAQMCVLEYLPE